MKYLISIMFFTLYACNNKEPKPIKLNIDQCAFCKMQISDGKFGAELITDKGKVFKFDDISCMIAYAYEHKTNVNAFFVNDFTKDNFLINVNDAHFLINGSISSPMRGNIAAFDNETALKKSNFELKAKQISWAEILSHFK